MTESQQFAQIASKLIATSTMQAGGNTFQFAEEVTLVKNYLQALAEETITITQTEKESEE